MTHPREIDDERAEAEAQGRERDRAVAEEQRRKYPAMYGGGPRPAAPTVSERLKAMRARVEAATPGPWRTGTHPVDGCVIYDSSGQGGPLIYDEGGHTEADAAFIAAARTDVPALLAVAEAAVGLVAAMGKATELVDRPWWAWEEDVCIGCDADALDWRIIAHAPDCPALRLDAALAAIADGGER